MKALKTKNQNIILTLATCLLFSCQQPKANKQETKLWHNQQRELRYKPDGKGFVITNGEKRFNRAIYGTNTGFRVEAGDLPEFALYMPRMGGTLRLGLIKGKESKWLIDAQNIVARYEAGSMSYQIKDPMLGNGKLTLNLLAMADADGFILRIKDENIPRETKLFWGFGGASNKRFSREGDLGADPESVFYLNPKYCNSNEYFVSENSFNLYYGSGRPLSDNEIYENNYKPTPEEINATRLKAKKRLFGLVPQQSDIKISDATHQESPLQFYRAEKKEAPAITGTLKFNAKNNYFLILNPDTKKRPTYSDIPRLFEQAEMAREKIAGQFKINTPDKYINAAGATLATAADAVWDGQSFMHGAVAWRMPLNGWRGAYAADWLGGHKRAKTHFRGYFKSQYTQPKSGKSLPNPKTHLARQTEKKGTAIFTEGYISRSPGKINKPHHYDMNLVFIAQLLSHFQWTGDLEFLRESWPVLERHLAWEKRCFDANNDGLYDSYAAIWASDALEYSGGGVTHSSAYNYRANRIAAELASLIGKDPRPYLTEAQKIKKAVNKQLWMSDKGWFAEYKDLLGNQLLHPSAAVWTIYHAIDEGLANPFQAYQLTQYIDKYIPHIPIEANGLEPGKYYTISTTNWMPYTWSINNVALAEVLHTTLACWKSGRQQQAFGLTKGTILDYMFLGSCPGNFGQLSYYDAFRGELYRDFADPVGMASRALVEGLFGISPDMIHNKINITPGWPANWQYASMETPDIKIDFKQNGNIDCYKIRSHFPKQPEINIRLNARAGNIDTVKVNGKTTQWKCDETAIGKPRIIIKIKNEKHANIEIKWKDAAIEKTTVDNFYALGDEINISTKSATILNVYDPQQIFADKRQNKQSLAAKLTGKPGWKTAFVKLQQNQLIWWQAVSFELREPIELIFNKKQPKNQLVFQVQNNTSKPFNGEWKCGKEKANIEIPAKTTAEKIIVEKGLLPGSNRIEISDKNRTYSENIINWNIQQNANTKYEKINIADKYNDCITNIFAEQYVSPRSPYPTLSIPIQGIGDWCSYHETAEIDDSGLRTKASATNQINSPQGIPFSTPGNKSNNILFTSQWDNYPNSVEIPLSGKASHLYLLMAGSVHHMQIHMVNGTVEVKYKDGTTDILSLKSPENWWPIEQDYYEDGYAFTVNAPRPPRLYLKTGEWHLNSYNALAKNKTIKIEGGAASMLDLLLDKNKELETLKLSTNTNDIVIGLMAATLKRE